MRESGTGDGHRPVLSGDLDLSSQGFGPELVEGTPEEPAKRPGKPMGRCNLISGRLAEDSHLKSLGDGSRGILDVEFLVNVTDVGDHGVDADAAGLGNFLF